MPTLKADPELTQEIREMQGQLDRCKKIVSGILMSSGELRGEGTVRTSVDAFLAELVAEWRATRQPQGFEYTNSFGSNQQIVSDPAVVGAHGLSAIGFARQNRRTTTLRLLTGETGGS